MGAENVLKVTTTTRIFLENQSVLVNYIECVSWIKLRVAKPFCVGQ